VLRIDTTQSGVDYDGNLTKTLALTKQGANTLTLRGTNTFTGALTINAGDVVMSGSGNHKIGALTIGNAAYTLASAASSYVYVTNSAAYVGNAAADFGRMTVASNAIWASTLANDNTASAILNVGNNGRGILTVQDNAVISNRLYIGSVANSAGAIYQRGNSTVVNWCGRGSDARIGENGYGYYELSSGTLTNSGHCQVGHNLASIGILSQTGGRLQQGSVFQGELQISRGGTGVVSLTSGTFASTVGMYIGSASDNATLRGYGEFTVAGNADAYLAGNITMADRTNMFATVNLNGGRLTANTFTKGNRYGSLALLNFDGGTFRARTAGNLFGAGVNSLDFVNIYPGGATFDSTNLAVTVNANLRAPTGNGVSSITIAPRGGYIGPPMVNISGGGGVGATAIANFDSANGFVTGVTITSHGYDYTTPPTVTLSGGGTNLQTLVTGVTLAPNTSGGLTKKGSSTLILSGTNTYGGSTALVEGTLKPAHALAIPASTTFAFAGGTLDLNGLTLSNRVNTTGTLSGGITNGTLCSLISPAGEYWTGSQSYSMNILAGGTLQAIYLADVTAAGACDVLAVQGNIDLSNFSLQLVDLDGLNRSKQYKIVTCTGTISGTFASTNLPDRRWKFYTRSDGSLVLAFSDGTMLKLR
jgi:autotransporter-associated beta strand protein